MNFYASGIINMFQEHRVVVVTPAGRQRYLEALIPQVQSMKEIVDEYRLWVNTTEESDIRYMQDIAAEDPDFITLEYLPEGVQHSGNMSIHHFFRNCQDPKTVYVRFDDDIILLDTQTAFQDFLQWRIENPQFFLVYGTILNNAVCSHLLQRYGKLDTNRGFAGYACTDATGWKDPSFAENVHRQVLSQPDLAYFRPGVNWYLHLYERVSINCISWLGTDFAAFGGNVGADEEQWLSCDMPRILGRMNVIYGGYACVHYAFFTQRTHLDATDILDAYISKRSKQSKR